MVQFVMGQLVVYGSVLGGMLVVTELLEIVLLLALAVVLEIVDELEIDVGIFGSMPTQYE